MQRARTVLAMDYWLWILHAFEKFQNAIFSRYQKVLSWGNTNGSKITPEFFSIFFSTNMVVRGVQSFCILEGTSDPLIEQWLKFSSQFSPDI